MAIFACRNCGVEVIADAAACPKCGCRAPFTCAVCGTPVGALTAIGTCHPFSDAGEPLCAQHARQLCDHCHKPFPPALLVQRVARWEYIAAVHEMVAFPGMYCAACNATHQDPPKPAPRAKKGCLGIFLP